MSSSRCAIACSAAWWPTTFMRPATKRTPLVTRNTLLDEKWVEKLEDRRRAERCKVRSPITCKSRFGVCALLLRTRSGARPPRQHRRSGRRHRRAVDRRAGHAADHAYVPHRWCGIACGGGRQRRRSRPPATLKFNNLKTVQHAQGHWSRCRVRAKCRCIDDHGRERERYKVPYGAVDQRQGRRMRSRPARSSRTGIRIPIRSFRKSPVACASSTSSTASPCRSRPTN